MKSKKECCTFRVLNHLIEADDFKTMKQITAETGLKSQQVSATLTYLYRRKAIDAEKVGEMLWWYATPENDTRSCVREEMTEKILTKTRKYKGKVKRRKPSELPSR